MPPYSEEVEEVRHRYTEDDVEYIKKHYGKMSSAEIGKHIGVSGRSIIRKAQYLRDNGYPIPLSFRFTHSQDEYILEYRGIKAYEDIARHLGITKKQIVDRVHALKNAGWNVAKLHQDTVRPLVITDGYPLTPWHMRQSTRSQRLTLDWEPDKVEV